MPKVTDTRVQRARKLRDRLTNGPSWSYFTQTLTHEQATAQFRNWVSAWVIDELEDLIPELRKDKREAFNVKTEN